MHNFYFIAALLLLLFFFVIIIRSRVLLISWMTIHTECQRKKFKLLSPLLASIPPTASKCPTVAFLGFVRRDCKSGRRSGKRWYFRASITKSWAFFWSLNKGLLSMWSAINWKLYSNFILKSSKGKISCAFLLTAGDSNGNFTRLSSLLASLFLLSVSYSSHDIKACNYKCFINNCNCL